MFSVTPIHTGVAFFDILYESYTNFFLLLNAFKVNHIIIVNCQIIVVLKEVTNNRLYSGISDRFGICDLHTTD